MNYINAGVISPDEVRSVLREDVNSGYNTLSEEMEGEGENEENDPFADLLGGSETPQNPFSMDKEPDDWFTSKGSHIPIQEGESKEEAFQKHIQRNRKELPKSNNELKATPFKSGSEANKYFKQDKDYKEWNIKLSDEEKDAMFMYSGAEYRTLNTALRKSEERKLTKKQKNRIEKLDKVIENFNLSKPVTVYRVVEPEIASKITKTFQDKAFLSTSLDKKAILHHDYALLEINIPKGKGRGAYINDHSMYKNKEYEFLLKRNSKFKVTSKKKEKGRTIITMDLITE